MTGIRRLQPHESISAADPISSGSLLDARDSFAFTNEHSIRRLTMHRVSAKQSSTSLVYAQKLALKLFRRLHTGDNPDVEIMRFLAEIAHFPHIATYMGEASITPANGEITTVAILQTIAVNQKDGRQCFFGLLANYFKRIATVPLPPELSIPSFFNVREPLPQVVEVVGVSLDAATLMGRRTAEMHLALSSNSDIPTFAPEPYTADDLTQDADHIEALINSTMKALKLKLPTLDDLNSDAAGLLLSRRGQLISRCSALTACTGAGQRIRIHGAYHLSKSICVRNAAKGKEDYSENSTSNGLGKFILIDFEGDPALSFAERRRKQSPLRDVASMIRSFSYVAQEGLDSFLSHDIERAHSADNNHFVAWALQWQNAVAAEFLREYRKVIAANSKLLPPPMQSQILLDAYLLEKTLCELNYELNHRPQWIHIPMSGILSL